MTWGRAEKHITTAILLLIAFAIRRPLCSPSCVTWGVTRHSPSPGMWGACVCYHSNPSSPFASCHLLSHGPHSSTCLHMLGKGSQSDLWLIHHEGTRKVISTWPCPTWWKKFCRGMAANMSKEYNWWILLPNQVSKSLLGLWYRCSAVQNIYVYWIQWTIQLLKTTSCRLFNTSLVQGCFEIFAEYFKRV